MWGSTVYALLSIAAIAVSAIVWDRFFGGTGRRDPRMLAVFLAALLGAFLGAKLAFLVAEGWHHRDNLVALLSGRSVTGALIGGTVAVEFAKWWLRIGVATGDAFAVTVPMAIAIGRIGCVSAGCCQGVECEPAWWTVEDVHGHSRVPSAQLELIFNLAFLGWALVAASRGWCRSQRFNIYLISYGVFRFAHEYWRDDHRWFEAFGGYHAAALAIVVLGAGMCWRRAQLNAASIA